MRVLFLGGVVLLLALVCGICVIVSGMSGDDLVASQVRPYVSGGVR
jgi:hypothetical protein